MFYYDIECFRYLRSFPYRDRGCDRNWKLIPCSDPACNCKCNWTRQSPEGHAELKEAFFPTGNGRFEKTKIAFLTSTSFPFFLALVNNADGVVELKSTLVRNHQSLSSCCQWSGNIGPSDSRGTQLAGTSIPYKSHSPAISCAPSC